MIAALNSPIDQIGEHDFFFVHMIQHDPRRPGAALLRAGLTGPILRPVLAIRTVDRLRILTHPFVALPLWALDLYIWHFPFMYQAALQHASCTRSSTPSSSPAAADVGARRRDAAGAGLVRDRSEDRLHRAVRVIETVLGNIFIWSTPVFYPWYIHAHATGDHAVHDQNLAGVVMMGEGGLVTLAALAWLFLRLAEEGELGSS